MCKDVVRNEANHALSPALGFESLIAWDSGASLTKKEYPSSRFIILRIQIGEKVTAVDRKKSGSLCPCTFF
jgi:hypothetical protein